MKLTPPALTRNTQGRPGSAQMSAIARGGHQGQARCRRGAGQDRRRLNYETQASDKTSACCNTKSTARASWSGGYLYFRKMRLTINRSFTRTVSRTDQSTETFFRKFSANSAAIFFNICVFAVNKRDKGKKGPLAASDNFELVCGESVKLSEQRLTEHEASFHFCFYRGNSRPSEILL